MRFGKTMLPKYTPGSNALYVDPTTAKLVYKDDAGTVHPLY